MIIVTKAVMATKCLTIRANLLSLGWKNIYKMLKKFIGFLLIFTIFLTKISYAQSLIRDGEVEKFLYDLANPIFSAADLETDNIKIYIINDNSINAFVALGQNIFINTGLIFKYPTPDTLIGVVAHEVGHIKGGHLARSGEGSFEANNAMILSYLLGLGAIVSGAPDAGAALILGGTQSAQRLYMKFTRTQEEAADQYAIAYLQKISYPPDGLIKLLEFFNSEMIPYKDQNDEYLLSHPVSKKRIDLLKSRTQNWTFSNNKTNDKLQKQMTRVQAKLEGFIFNPDETLEKYQNKNDENSNYIKSIAYFRLGKIAPALDLINPIIEKNPHDGFLYELKAQMLFESGQMQSAVLLYHKALKLIPPRYNTMTKISFAASILGVKTNDLQLINLAIRNLKEARAKEDDNAIVSKYLSDAYHKIHEEGKSYLALAQYNFAINQKEKAEKYAGQAKEKLKKTDKVELLALEDLLEEIKADKTEKKRF